MTSARKPVSRDDVVLTIVGLALLAPAVAGLAFYSVVVFFVSDSCGMPVTECNHELILAGHYIAKYGAIGIGIVALVASVLLIRSRRRAGLGSAGRGGPCPRLVHWRWRVRQTRRTARPRP